MNLWMSLVVISMLLLGMPEVLAYNTTNPNFNSPPKPVKPYAIPFYYYLVGVAVPVGLIIAWALVQRWRYEQ